MKKIINIIGIIIIVLINYSCAKTESELKFKDQEKYSIYSYMEANKDEFSSFLRIVQKGGIDKILSAYNPYADGYTLFLPDNQAVNQFIQQSGKYTSLEDMLNDEVYVKAFCRYHVVRAKFKTDDFPFGAFSETTLSGDLLTVSFISETDTAYYKINNQAPVSVPNIKTSNGYIHVISKVLQPIIFTSYNWLEQHPGYSIFKEAVDVTGLKSLLDVDTKDANTTTNPFTLLLEHDSVFAKYKVHNLQDLENLISPGNTNYTSPYNPLYNFITYHVLIGTNFLNTFESRGNTNYNTYSDIPLRIDGTGTDIHINPGRENFDTIISGVDTTIIDFIGINYDASNVLTQSGVIHLIDHVMTQKSPTTAIQNYQFYEERYFDKFRQVAGTYLVEDSTAMTNIKYSGADLFFITGESSSTAWNKDYIMMNGNFVINYTIPKLVQGIYKIKLRAESLNINNAVIVVYIDGKNIGGQINLTTGGVSWDPFRRNDASGNEVSLGKFNFIKYEQHTITIKSLIPGRFLWDAITFEPTN